MNTRLPLMEVAFEAGAVTVARDGVFLPVEYMTMSSSDMSADLLGLPGGDGEAVAEPTATWAMSYDDGAIEGDVRFRLSAAGGRVLAIPARVDETYTGRIVLRQKHGVLPGALVNLPPADRETTYMWEAHAVTTLIGASSATAVP